MAAKKIIKKPRGKHTDHTAQPYTGPLQADATAVSALLVDLPPGSMQGLRKSLAGIDEVVAELAVAVPAYGPAAGVSAAVYQSFVARSNDIKQLTPLAQIVGKLAEVLAESIAVLQDAREQDLGQIVDAVRSAEKRKKNAGVSAPFQKTLAYKARAAHKAVKTRRKKAAAKATSAAAHQGP